MQTANKYANKITQSEKWEDPTWAHARPSNMHDVDEAVCQLVCESIRDDKSAAAGM